MNNSYGIEDEMDFQCAEEIPINETRIIDLPLGDEKNMSAATTAINNNNLNNLNAISINEYMRK